MKVLSDPSDSGLLFQGINFSREIPLETPANASHSPTDPLAKHSESLDSPITENALRDSAMAVENSRKPVLEGGSSDRKSKVLLYVGGCFSPSNEYILKVFTWGI